MNKNYFFREIFFKNPVLVGMVGLCPIVAICTSLKSAFIMSIITILTLILAQVLTTLVFGKLPQWLRMGLYTLVGMAVVVPAILIIEKMNPETMLAFGIYLPLLAVNPVIVRQCEREGSKSKLGKAILSAICEGLGYSIVLLIVGFFREIIGSGSIGGYEISFLNPAKAFLMPMGGFIAIAYLAAILRAYFKKHEIKFTDDIMLKAGAKASAGVEHKADDLLGSKARTGDKKPAPARRKPQPQKAKTPSGIEVMTLEQAEEEKAQAKPPVESTIQAELAEEKPLPSNATVTHKTSQFEFITLDLSAEEKSSDEVAAFAAAVAESTAMHPQRQKIKRNQTKTVKGERADAPRQTRKTIPLKEEAAPGVVEAAPKVVEVAPEVKEVPAVKEISVPREEPEIKEAPAAKEAPKASGRQTFFDLTRADEPEEKPAVEKAPEKDAKASIAYKTAELEKLMSMSLDDIINSMPDSSTEKGKEGDDE